MNDELSFDYSSWLKDLHESYTEAINKTVDEFEEGLLQDSTFDQQKLRAGMATIKKKMLASVTVNIDRLETFYMQNTHVHNSGPNYEFIQKIENRANKDKNYQEKVDAIFKEIQTSCEEFGNKKQQYLKYCLYDKYIDKEKKFLSNDQPLIEGSETNYFDLKTQEDRIYNKAKEDKDFLKDFKNYIELFENMQTDLLKKLN